LKRHRGMGPRSWQHEFTTNERKPKNERPLILVRVQNSPNFLSWKMRVIGTYGVHSKRRTGERGLFQARRRKRGVRRCLGALTDSIEETA